jgi:tetratricopeptide (TPR) repeat protein
LEPLAREYPTIAHYQQFLANTQNNLGLVYKSTRRWAEAEDALHRALTVRERVVREHPDGVEYAEELGGALCNLGNLLRQRNQSEPALAWYSKAIRTLEEVLRRQSGRAQARQFLRNAHTGRAQALDALGRYGLALPDWDQAVALAEEPARTDLRLLRACSLARLGKHDQATAAVEELAGREQASGDLLYNVACVYALSVGFAEREPRLRERYATRAVEVLRRATEKGFRNVALIQQDPDLAAIRGRGDFQKLLTELGGKATAPNRDEGAAGKN